MRLIDADKAISDYAHYGISHSYDAYDLEDILAECPTIEAIEKDQYEARLKADMVAMLEELKEQLRKMHEDYFETEHFDEAYGLSDSIAIIQQKIDKIKGL